VNGPQRVGLIAITSAIRQSLIIGILLSRLRRGLTGDIEELFMQQRLFNPPMLDAALRGGRY
jgi:hypothetical protein